MKKHNTDPINVIMERLGKILSETNIELVKITEGGFPFTLEDVVLTASYDNVGIYVHSGLTPVCVLVRAGNPDTVVSSIKAKIREVLESTKAAVERRASLRDEAHALQAEGEKNERAVQALQAAGLDATEILGKGIDAESRAAIRAAVNKAVQEANRPPFLGLVPYKDWKLVVDEYASGIVIKAGDKPVLVTRYPKVTSPKVVEQMTAWITNDVAALNASRMRYFERVRLEADREEKLRSLSLQQDNINERIAAAM